MRFPTKRRVIGVLIAATLATPALATGQITSIITPADQTRLDNYAQTRESAIKEAEAGGDPQQVTEVKKILDTPQLDFAGMDLTGEWQCRTIKIGNNLPLVVYSWFRCRVTDDGSGWQLEKLTGSQKTKGRFFDDGPKRMTYLGSHYVNEDTPPAYGAGKESDQAGYAFRMSDTSWRIEFPKPYYESNLDVLEFRR